MSDESFELEGLSHRELVERARALQTVLRVSHEAALGGDVSDLSARFVDAMVAYTRFPSVVVLRYLPDHDAFRLIAQRGFDESKFPFTFLRLLSAKGSLTGLAAERGGVLTSEDIADDPRLDPETREGLMASGYESAACLPLIHAGEVLGSFNLLYPHGTSLPDGERRMLCVLADGLAVAMAQRLSVERERRLDQQARRAQQLESLGVLAGGIAHDFNNLLMGIVGNIEIASLSVSDGNADRGLARLTEALSAADRAAALARQLLTFSRGGAPSLRWTDDLGKALEEVASFTARGTSVRCDVQVEEPLGAVKIDADQIAQVIQNLVLNACQASPKGAAVRLRARRVAEAQGDAHVVIEVSDDGVGIEPALLPHIFEPFFSGRAGGTGLGLAVSHSIVGHHGGRLTVDSTLGSGTTFTLTLPASQQVLGRSSARSGELVRFEGRALVMDDDDQVRPVAQQMLQRLGFDVDAARHGGEAVECARDAVASGRPYRVALLDLTVVGGLGGADIAAQLRSISPGVRLILASGYAYDADRPGWDARLQKPFRLLDLSRALRKALGDATEEGSAHPT